MAIMRTKTDMRRLVRVLNPGDAFASSVLSKGKWFLGRANVDDYELAKEWKKKRRPRAQNCFLNGQQFCIDHQGYSYYEGYVLIGGHPMQHGWIVWDDGNVVDFTLEAVLRKAKRDHNVVDDRPPLYLGLEIPRNFVMQCFVEGQVGDPIGESYCESRG